MSKTYEKLDDKLIEFIKAQKMFFVATSPLSRDGHVNVSPKGYDSFVVIDESTVAWLDLGGSGIETMAHLKENGRITIMFCAFDGAANIVRLYGQGEAVQFDDPRFAGLLALFSNFDKARAIVLELADAHADILEVVGCPVVNLGGSSVDLSLRAWCNDAATAKAVEFDLLEQVKKRFDVEGIEIPYAYQNVLLSGSVRLDGQSAEPVSEA